MEDLLLGGYILYPEGLEEGWIDIRDGTVHSVSADEVQDLPADHIRIEGIVIPGLMDLHTHLGDHLARGSVPRDIRKAVFPGGYKDRMLRKAGPDRIRRSIGDALGELEPGVTDIIDFREGGKTGIELLREASKGSTMNVLGLGRPFPGESSSDILRVSDGFGIPSLSSDLGELRDMARGSDKIFSIHASEAFRDDIDLLIDLVPDLVVHMISGEREDWKALAERSIPVVICPRSNSYYGLGVPLREMIDEGLMLGLGTDNSMTCFQDMFEEMRYGLETLGSESGTIEEDARTIFEMAVGRGCSGSDLMARITHTTRWWEDGWPRRGDPPELSVIRTPSNGDWMDDPYSYLVRNTTRDHVLLTGSNRS